jgi:pimeloyl-ACP methyl ester carboxylesterase
LLLINGIGASLEALGPFVTALSGAVEVIRFDPPGVGGSPLPPGPYRFTALILAGDDDPIIPLANARLMDRLIRDSRLHVYPGGHLGLLTEAAGLAPVVDGFLAGP